MSHGTSKYKNEWEQEIEKVEKKKMSKWMSKINDNNCGVWSQNCIIPQAPEKFGEEEGGVKDIHIFF